MPFGSCSQTAVMDVAINEERSVFAAGSVDIPSFGKTLGREMHRSSCK